MYARTTVAPDKSLVMLCKRRSPQVVVMPVSTPNGPQFVPMSFYPVVQAKEECGEWTARAEGAILAS
jgi:hypothetical protein